MTEGRNGFPSLYSASPFIEEERTTSDALVATVKTWLQHTDLNFDRLSDAGAAVFSE